jgi:1-acylglycerone phosphate reductase
MSQKSVFIVGASSGIGYGLALEFAERGWKVYAGSRSVRKMAPLKDKGIHVVYVDITDQESINAAKELIQRENAGRLDVLYLNAGVAKDGPLLDIPMEDIESSFRTNVFGPIRVIKTFQYILLQNQAAVAFTSSLVIHTSLPFRFAYAATKTSFDILARMLSMECGDLGIKVINIRTGAVESEIWSPPLIPGKDSVYYTGTDEPLGAFEPSKMATGMYCVKAVSVVERALKKKAVYTQVYRGAGTFFGYLLGMLPFRAYRRIVIKITNLAEPFRIAKERIFKEKQF